MTSAVPYFAKQNWEHVDERSESTMVPLHFLKNVIVVSFRWVYHLKSTLLIYW